ncbi:oligosaccharide flippase family protein [Erwinia sp. PK3-005]
MSSKRSIISSFIGLSSINVLNIIIPIITMPYLSRVLTPSGYGIFLLFSSIYIFIFILIDYSSNIYAVREIAGIIDKNKEQEIYTSIQSVRLFFSVISFFLGVVYIITTQSDNISFPFLVLNIFVTVIGYYLTAPWYHQGKQDMMILAVSSFIARALQLIVIFYLVKSTDDLKIAVISTSLVFFITGIISYLYRRYRTGIKEKIKVKTIYPNLKLGFDSFIGDFAPNLYSNLPPLLIGLFTSPALFANYSLSMRLVNIAGSFQLMLAKAIYPSVVRGDFSLGRMTLINTLTGFIPVIFIFLFGSEIINIFLGQGYADVALYLKYLSPSILFASLLYSLSYGYFFPNKLDGKFRNISLLVSVISAIVGYFLIYKIGIIGAIIMFIMARFLFVIFYTYNFIKLNKK